MDIASAIKDYGFPIVAAVAMGGFIYYIWRWVTETINPLIGSTKKTLINLIDRVRMLDNDMIRLNTKLSMVLEHQGKLDKKRKAELEEIVAKYQSQNETFNSTGKPDQQRSTDAGKK